MDASSGYHILMHDKRDYNLKQHCWGNIHEILKMPPNVFEIAGDILIVGYNNNGADCDGMICRVLQICRKENLKLNKDKGHFRCTSPLFLPRLCLGKVWDWI